MGTDRESHRRALDLCEQATELLQEGRIEEALETFERSIEAFPTAEGYTYRGWARSFQGEIAAAIEDCHTAIRIDPGFGNPYNDIGCYLIQSGRPEEAMEWLQRAKDAPRYTPRHFPYLNMGRIYAAKGMLREALAEFRAALRIRPDDEAAAIAADKMRLSIN